MLGVSPSWDSHLVFDPAASAGRRSRAAVSPYMVQRAQSTTVVGKRWSLQKLVWEPPTRLVFEWRATNFAPDEKTEVEVVFTPSGDGTLVRVQHRGFAGLRPDHPVRHGQPVAAFIRAMGMWWGELMTSLREHAATRAPPR